MKVSKGWLKELVDLKADFPELERLLPLRSIGTKEITSEFIELDMKGYNRSDLLSMRGVALEVAAITDSQITFDNDEDAKELFFERREKLNSSHDVRTIKVEITNSNLCPFYSLVKIENLKVGPSPKEWVQKLQECGMRSINNVADITNLIMLEFGQPMHAFDAAKISQEAIIVRTAQEGEEIETLDEKVRKLDPSDLLITDPDKALGIAGVMGGKNSEVTTETTTVLLEAAIFEPRNLRQTATRLGLISEAGKRFYHGLTKKRLYQALNAAAKMYEQLGGGVTAYAVEDHLTQTLPRIELSIDKVHSLIGVEIPKEEIENYLTRLHFSLEQQSNGWLVTPPYWRMDIEIKEDLIEEIARLYGYERIPAINLQGEIPEKVDQELFELIYQAKQTLAEEGLTEVQTYSFYSTDILNNVALDQNTLVKVANPISTETEFMRDQLWPNLVEVVSKNFKKYNFDDIAVFEVGKVYSKDKDSNPKEKYLLAMALMNGTDNPSKELYQLFKQLSSKLFDSKIELEGFSKGTDYSKSFFHPKRFLPLKLDDKYIGGLAEVHPRIINKFGLEKRVAIVEIDLESL